MSGVQEKVERLVAQLEEAQRAEAPDSYGLARAGSPTDMSVRNTWGPRRPATEEAIASAEARTGASLPPSYRTFLRLSNGWCGFLGDDELFPIEVIADPKAPASARVDFLDICEDEEYSKGTIVLGGGRRSVYLLRPAAKGEEAEVVMWHYDGDPEPLACFLALLEEAVRRTSR